MHNGVYDEFGPYKIINLNFPKEKFSAVVCVYNTALGPGFGGVRMSPLVTTTEVVRLARAMMFKNSAANLPYGGGKAGIIADPRDPRREEIFRLFARAIKDISEYIPAPDMGSDEESMVWIKDEIGRVAGLPKEIGGLPIDEYGATGYGLAVSAKVACEEKRIPLKGATVAIQGFGNVGRASAEFLIEKGAVIVAINDVGGTIVNPQGITDIEGISNTVRKSNIKDYKLCRDDVMESQDSIISVPCDIMIPAARPDVIDMNNVESVKAKIILQGANIPITLPAEKRLHEKGTLIITDFIANAGGVIMAAAEMKGSTKKEAYHEIKQKITNNTEQVLDIVNKKNILPREAAESLAEDRIRKIMRLKK